MQPTSSRKRSASQDEAHAVQESNPPKVAKIVPSAPQPDSSQQADRERRERSAKVLYDDTLSMIDRNVRVMDRQVSGETGDDPLDYTTDDYARLVCRHSKIVNALAVVDNTLAFNLVLSMADASHTDLDTTLEMCGEDPGETARYFQSLDNLLLPLIKYRQQPAELCWQLLQVPGRWSQRRTGSQDAESDEDPDEWSEPDYERQYWEKCNYEHNRRIARRRWREIVDDWVTVALNDLKDERDYLDLYGITGFFPESIAEFEAIRMQMSTGV
ncbi:unnamed protein product [Fusarium graminearum]|uniref:Uncharacterized protein n=1 Tax=Gibberella zeae TaxID=5518 RepID=A0A2H3HAL3_GIBZA|nr:hypothetical protein HG531_009189 [Fusarium graminearum]PCD34409.1 hypothetical protein FGRA07_08727 [Fusarium graminearum]CAG1960443.1 unnamed protein product [Fusarium graminearum]CAG1982550.1 unnamed protein product [Fusarium graminearum]CAG1992254.1 unnamed protein product [Fusarium graminearum]